MEVSHFVVNKLKYAAVNISAGMQSFHLYDVIGSIFMFTGNIGIRSKRSVVSFTTSNDYTMEVLVAVDSKMEEYHGENMKNYVLILMSIVSSIYLDPSIGNAIKVAVVHILLIHDDVNVKDLQSGWNSLLLIKN